MKDLARTVASQRVRHTAKAPVARAPRPRHAKINTAVRLTRATWIDVDELPKRLPGFRGL
jgi:hypothetical protein